MTLAEVSLGRQRPTGVTSAGLQCMRCQRGVSFFRDL